MQAKCVCLGIEPRLGTASIHQVETLAHVPYRYIKEYSHPVEKEKGVENDLFYRYVWYENCGIKRSGNEFFFNELVSSGLKIHRYSVGSGFISCFDLSDFVTKGVKIMQRNPYIWLNEPPTSKPWVL